jgi:transcriptional regulator with XRE-family HTH domain
MDTNILRKRMKLTGITLKDVAYRCGESEQTVCRVLNQKLIDKIHDTASKLVREANAELTKELFDSEYAS